MSPRVIAGSAKGRRLKMVPGDSTRPVMDRVKEALFSILGMRVAGSNFLDLYAGTGSVGIEALSRGATQATFIELDRLAIKTIQENLKTTRLADQAVIRRVDVLALLAQSPPEDYDFIYIAPPQYKKLWLKTLEVLDQNPAWISDTTRVIVQIDPHEQEAVSLTHLQARDERRYGRTLLWFFDKKEEVDE